MGFPLIILLLISLFSNALQSHATVDSLIRLPTITTISVLDYGAIGDGVTDDTQAFNNAWSQTCSSSRQVILEVPQEGSYLVKPLIFSGPCKSQITVEISGDIIASVKVSDYSADWLRFEGLDSLIVQGGGTVDGRGNVWWQNSCRNNPSKPCKNAPTALLFYNCNNLIVNNLKIQNSQQIHVEFNHCSGVQASYLTVTAPAMSPNTDGIHVAGTQNIHISNCKIATGDDCISIVSGSAGVRATDITCGPGHGISIGSLGSGNSMAHVSDVIVNGANFTGTTNGVRIKTWEGGSGIASNIRFENIVMHDVMNPIIIDQSYCDQNSNLPCTKNKGLASAVQIKNVTYVDITGTSGSNDAIILNCSKNYPCQEIMFENVKLTAVNGGQSAASCINVNPNYVGTISPLCAGVSTGNTLWSSRKLLNSFPG